MAKTHHIVSGVIQGILGFALALVLSLFVRTCFSQPEVKAETVQEGEESVEQQSPLREEILLAETTPVQIDTPIATTPPQEVVVPFVSVQDENREEKVEEIVEESQAKSPVEDAVEVKPLPVPAMPALVPIVVPSEARTPQAPSFKSAKVKAMVPEPPYMFEPTVMSQEEYDLFYAPMPQDDGGFEEEDPFADFFIAGENDDSLLYEDGTYYLTLYLNEDYYGEIETVFSGEQKLVNMEELKDFIGTELSESAYQRLFGDGHDYLSLDDLAGRNVQSRFDSNEFALYLTIPYSDLALRTLSVSSRSLSRREQYAMSGALDLKPAKFSWVASMNFYGSLTYPDTFDEVTSKSVSWYVNNSISFLQIGLDFSFSLYNSDSDSLSKWKYNLGNWVAFHEFEKKNQRLTFGSVGSNLSDRTTTSMGISTNMGFTLEKNYGYGGGSAAGNQYSYTINVVEPSNVYIYLNETVEDEGESAGLYPSQEELADRKNLVFSRHLQPGVYRLKDFVFTQGYNKVKIYLYPDSRPTEPEVIHLDTSYDSRLMGKGDSTWGFGVSMPKGMTDSSKDAKSAHYYDALRQKWVSYYPEYFTARFWQSAGVTDTFTLTSDFSATPGVFSGSLNGVWANWLGTTQIQSTGKLSESYKSPILSASLTERFNNTVMRGAGSLSMTFTYNAPSEGADTSHSDISQSVTSSFSYSGKGLVTKLGYSLSGSVSYVWDQEYPTWTMSASTGASPFKGFSLSASATLSGSDSNKPWHAGFVGTVSASYSFSPRTSGSTSTTYNSNTGATSSVGASYRPTSTDSLSLSVSGLKWEDGGWDNSTLYASYMHTGKTYSLSLRQQASNGYKRLSTSANLATSIAFADGVFGMARSVNNVFLLVKPRGMLKKSQVSIARSMDSSPTLVSRYLGSALYSSLSPYVQNSVVIFSGGEGNTSGTTSLFKFTPRVRQAYVAYIDLPDTYTVSGMLNLEEGTPFSQYSSPVYHYSEDEQGNAVLQADSELYLFTDQVGRYILSDVEAGSYAFDLQVGESRWILVRFEVPPMEDKKLRVLELEDLYADGPYLEQEVEGYDQVISLGVLRFSDEESFWNMVFPPVDEMDFGEEFTEEVSAEPQVLENAAP